MDSVLRCNDLKCRAQLSDQAVVTTCSHIFCLSCADRLELSAPRDGQRKCPACSTYLYNPDDAVVTSLSPSEDYKTSILSGLSPNVINECTSRGMQFWSYQMAQEVYYQEHIANSMRTKYAGLSAQMDTMVREANDENNKLLARIEAMHTHESSLQDKMQRMEHDFKEKDKAYKQLHNMYSKIKHHQIQNQMANGFEMAAEQEADHALQGATQRSTQQSQQQMGGRRPHRAGSNGSGGSGEQRQRMTLSRNNGYASQTFHTQGNRPGLNSAHSAPMPTPGQRRQLPNPAFGAYNASVLNGNYGTGHHDSLRQATPRASQDYGGGIPNVGMSANARVGRQPTVPPLSRAGGGPAAAGFGPVGRLRGPNYV